MPALNHWIARLRDATPRGDIQNGLTARTTRGADCQTAPFSSSRFLRTSVRSYWLSRLYGRYGGPGSPAL